MWRHVFFRWSIFHVWSNCFLSCIYDVKTGGEKKFCQELLKDFLNSYVWTKVTHSSFQEIFACVKPKFAFAFYIFFILISPNRLRWTTASCSNQDNICFLFLFFFSRECVIIIFFNLIHLILIIFFSEDFFFLWNFFSPQFHKRKIIILIKNGEKMFY